MYGPTPGPSHPPAHAAAISTQFLVAAALELMVKCRPSKIQDVGITFGDRLAGVGLAGSLGVSCLCTAGAYPLRPHNYSGVGAG